MKPYLSTISIFILSINIAYASRVFIFSDVHGDVNFFNNVINLITKDKRVGQIQYVIANGDFLSEGKMNQLQGIFNILKQNLRVQPQNIFVAPGNWDSTLTGMSPKTALNYFRSQRMKVVHDFTSNQYKNVLRFNKFNEESMYTYSGVIKIDGINIMVGHFPQFIIPAEALPQEGFLYTFYKNQGHLLLTMNRKIAIPSGINLVLFSHTHIRTIFYGKNGARGTNKVLVVNSGGLDAFRKNYWETNSFAILDTRKRAVEIFEIQKLQNGTAQILKITSYPLRRSGNTLPLYDILDWRIAYETPYFKKLMASPQVNAPHLINSNRRKGGIDKFVNYFKNYEKSNPIKYFPASATAPIPNPTGFPSFEKALFKRP
jgi:predicted phosphodiesterase